MIFGSEVGIIFKNRVKINFLILLVRQKYKLSNMGPKKNQEPEPILLGRFGTSLKVGIVGVPNVGKSTFFNVLTKSQAAAENFPFCTIDPNESRVPVPDERWDFLCEYYQPLSKVPAFLNVVDIAGLVEGANEGQGLGNAFLSHIKACDAIFQMLRAFDDDDVTHVDGSVDPCRDLKTILKELRLKDVEYFKARLGELERKVRSNDKKVVEEHTICTRIVKLLVEDEVHLRFVKDWANNEIEYLNKHLPITAKPMLYLVNLSESDYFRKKNKWLAKIKAWIDENDPGAQLIPFSGVFEQKAFDMPADEFAKYCEENKTQSILPKIIKSGFQLLQLQYFFTAGKDEVKAWTIQKGTKAPAAAGKIHTDFEKGFIMAEVMKFDDFKELKSETAVKNAGKYKQQGKGYTVEDGDIIFFKFNAGAGLTPGAGAKKK
ncbi:obg-like ATPase 1 isoform X2 [Hydra vulgaris]|uniref:Obg-like ATPase 1 n=1 Tax=Hydra vulgaris TaxID=6087 RepID=A0ABM4C4Y5_HYDVU